MKCVVKGPRGGLALADVCCDTCVCANKCGFSGPNTRRWGCFDWVDVDGRRVATDEQCVDDAAVIPENIEAAIPLQRELNTLQSARLDNIAAADIPVEVAEATMEPDPKEDPGA